MSMYNKKSGSTDSKTLSRFKRSTLAVCIMAACGAQAQEQSAGIVEEVLVVRGIKGSLKTSQDLKRDAATVKDIITSADINAFPDKSVAEALQRLPGVNIERFAASDDPDHFSVEGSGVVIRGLTRIRSEFNGRDTFSADGSGGLNFSDVPPELLGSVEVSKNATSSMIEGGIAGTVNLNTRKPFDNRDQLISVTAKGGYGDLSDEFSPSLSGLYSNVWETSNIGTIGFLINVSASELNTRSDGVGLYNYYERSAETTPLALYPTDTIIAPPSTAIRTQENERQRFGLTASAQWASIDEDITVTLEYVRSESSLIWREHYIEYGDQAFSTNAQNDFQIGPDQGDMQLRTSENGFFQSGIIQTSYYQTGSRLQDGERNLSDLSLKVDYDITDNLLVTADFQLIKSDNRVDDAFATISFQADTYLDLRGDVPVVEFLDASMADENASSDETFYRSILGHAGDNDGDQKTFAGDMEYTFDEGFVKAVKGGVRLATRTQTNRDTDYDNWGNISESWNGGVNSQVDTMIANGDSDLLEQYEFDNFHRGGALRGLDTFIFPNIDTLANTIELDRRLVEGGYVTAQSDTRENLVDREGVIPGTPFLPSDISTTRENRGSVYVQVDFGFFATDSIELRGNAGLRYVDYSWQSRGQVQYPELRLTEEAQAFISEEDLRFSNGAFGAASVVDGTDDAKVLPSFNLSTVFNDEFIVRVAASRALFFPNLSDVSAEFSIDPQTDFIRNDEDVLENVVIQRYTSSGGGNPLLEPEESDQFDLSFEWYFSDVGSISSAFFYKDISNIIRSGESVVPITNQGVTRNVFQIGKINAGDANVQGVELAYQQSFDFLPEPFDGFGTQINYTYIDQSGGNTFDPAFDSGEIDAEDYNIFTNLPIEGLSDNSFNVVVFYENDAFNARLAYNWRSEYLLNSRDVIAYAPVYAADTGQLDGSFNYNLTEDITFGVELNNLLDEVTETRVQYNQEGTLTPRNYFVNDRRITLTARASF